MKPQIERRQSDRRSSDEELSPEYLALLDVCGGEIRASDRAVLSSRRQGMPGEAPDASAEGDAARGEKVPATADAAPAARDRRSPTR
jgi:hypothetical protein